MTTAFISRDREQAVRDSVARQGFIAGLGAELTTVETGRCLIEMPFGPRVSQQHGFFHGGAIGALADTAGGYAEMTVAPHGSDVRRAMFYARAVASS